jgi:hypothetical protein
MPKITIPGGFFDADNHVYTDEKGMRIASTTQVLAGLGMVDYSRVKEEVLERKSAIGVAAHASIQYLCEGTLDWDSVAEEVMGYVVAGETWMREQKFTSLSQEGQGICELSGMKFGFQYDHLGELDFKGRRRKVILDLKTCVSSSPTWKLQTAAYALAAPNLPPGERYLRVILQLKADGGFRPHYFEDRADEQAWPHILFTYIYGLNSGLYTLEAAA